VGCIYFPPNAPSSLYNEYFSILDNLISSRRNDDQLFGDFNLPHLNKASLNANLNLSSPEAIFLENLAFGESHCKDYRQIIFFNNQLLYRSADAGLQHSNTTGSEFLKNK